MIRRPPRSTLDRSSAASDVYKRQDIIEFASEIGIHPGIIVGRLHHDGKIPFSQANGLRTQFTWDN